MSRQLIASGKSLGTAGKCAAVWLFAGVSSDVSGLMFKTMERFVTESAFVWSVFF